MKILFLGPECLRIEFFLKNLGHTVVRVQEKISLSMVKKENFDFGLSYRYIHLIKTDLIKWFQGRLINMHISYLPWNKGADPNIWSFLTKTPSGASIHIVDEKLDTGDLLLRQQVVHDLESSTLKSSYNLLIEIIEQLFIDNAQELLSFSIKPTKQELGGSFHTTVETDKYSKYWAKLGWDTPVRELYGKAL